MKSSMFWRLGAALACSIVLMVAVVNGQPEDGRSRGGPGGFGGPIGGGGLVGLVMRDEVQQELQLVDEQREKVMDTADEAREQFRNEMSEQFSQMRELSEDERRAKFDEIRGRMEAMSADVEAKLKKLLLPHQFERLKQIDLQVRLQQRGASALSSGDMAEELDLTDEQREKLEARAEEVRQEMQTKIRQLQTEARDKMLDVLTPEQRSKLDKLMGDSFELREGDPRFGGRGGFRGDGRSDRRERDRGREQSPRPNEAI